MNQKSLWIVLIIAIMVFSASCHSGAAKEETTPAGVWQQFKVLSARVITALRNMAVELTAPRLKDRQDICIWKICSRPLKKTNNMPEEKQSETGGRLSDSEIMSILKTFNSRRVGIYRRLFCMYLFFKRSN